MKYNYARIDWCINNKTFFMFDTNKKCYAHIFFRHGHIIIIESNNLIVKDMKIFRQYLKKINTSKQGYMITGAIYDENFYKYNKKYIYEDAITYLCNERPYKEDHLEMINEIFNVYKNI